MKLTLDFHDFSKKIVNSFTQKLCILAYQLAIRMWRGSPIIIQTITFKLQFPQKLPDSSGSLSNRNIKTFYHPQKINTIFSLQNAVKGNKFDKVSQSITKAKNWEWSRYRIHLFDFENFVTYLQYSKKQKQLHTELEKSNI